jgi:hypothetical protein
MLRCHGRANRGLSATSHTRIKGISRHWSPALLTTKRDPTAGLLEVFLHPHVGNCMWPQLQIRVGVNTIQWSSSLESRPLQAWRELADTLQNTDLPPMPCGQNAVNINKLENYSYATAQWSLDFSLARIVPTSGSTGSNGWPSKHGSSSYALRC